VIPEIEFVVPQYTKPEPTDHPDFLEWNASELADESSRRFAFAGLKRKTRPTRAPPSDEGTCVINNTSLARHIWWLASWAPLAMVASPYVGGDVRPAARSHLKAWQHGIPSPRRAED